MAAARLFELRNTHKGNFSFADASAALDMYCSDGYRYDRHYREFCAACAEAALPGWEPLRAMAEEVERAYDQAFLAPFGREWTRLLDAGFLQSWCLPDRAMQHNFFRDQIRPVLQESEKRKAYVIISDALRFEAAHELVESMNGKYRMRAELDWMLGVLPSYTALGMASLLPHKKLAYADKEIVEADGKSTQGAGESR
ncbi:MAG: PglZ domain-containing protein [bacterium]|nr:PglZ domain-containing protein [bacterium]